MSENPASELPYLDIPGANYYVELNSNGHCRLLSSRAEFASMAHLFDQIEPEQGGQLVGYCLFQDSIHLLLRTGPSGMDRLVQWLIDTHTQAYNRLHKRNGSLYAQDYLAVLIDPQRYLLPCIHKLHWLPVKAGLVSTPSAYPWSSQREYLAPDCPRWLQRNDVLVRVANHRASQLRRFEHFIENPCPISVDWLKGCNQQYLALADDSYVNALLNKRNQNHASPTLDLEALSEWICSEYGLDERDLQFWRRHRLSGEIQAVVAALARQFKLADLPSVANYFAADQDILATGIRSLQARRGMFIHTLQTRLGQWLSEQYQPVDNLEAGEREADTSGTQGGNQQPVPKSKFGEIEEELVEPLPSPPTSAPPPLNSHYSAPSVSGA